MSERSDAARLKNEGAFRKHYEREGHLQAPDGGFLLQKGSGLMVDAVLSGLDLDVVCGMSSVWHVFRQNLYSSSSRKGKQANI